MLVCQQTVDAQWDSVRKCIDDMLYYHVGYKRVGGFNTQDGAPRPWMSEPAVAAAIAARAASHKLYKLRRISKKKYNRIRDRARVLQKAAKRRYRNGLYDELAELDKSKEPGAAAGIERILRALQHIAPGPSKPLPPVKPYPPPQAPSPEKGPGSGPETGPGLETETGPELTAQLDMTSTELASSEQFANRWAELGAKPDLPSDDPKALLEAEIQKAHAAFAPDLGTAGPLTCGDKERSGPEWTRIQCDGGCDNDTELELHPAGAGYTLASGDFTCVSMRSECTRKKGEPATCTCHQSAASSRSIDNKHLAEDGNVFRRKALFVSADGTNNQAEFAAVYNAVKDAIACGCTHLDIHTDSEFVVNCVIGCNTTSDPLLRTYLFAICQLLQQTSRWCISHIHREANSAADALADDGKSPECEHAAPPPAPSPEVRMSTAYMHPHLHMRSYVGSHRSPHSLLRSLTTEQLNAYALQPMETAAAIDWVGSDTAPGPDGHVPGVYKLAKPGMTRILTAFFNLCWSTGRTPSQWKGCHVRMLHKKGDTADVNNYRGISLLDVASKLYERVNYKRLEESVVSRGKLPAELYGFLRQHSQSHALFSAIEAIKHNRRMGRYVVVLSADIKKAYPTMLRAQMLNDLHELGVDESLFHAIASMYTGNRSRILTSRPGVMSSEYTVENGLREGAVLSPLLYCIFTAALMRKLQAPENAPYGMHVGTEWTGAQLYADDQLLMTAHEDLDSAKSHMRHLMQVLKADAKEKHYSYSAAKSEVMVIGACPSEGLPERAAPEPAWPLGKEVDEITFLGCVLHKSLSWDRHIAFRQSKADDALWHVRQLASHRRLPIKWTKLEFDRTFAQSLLYGADAIDFGAKSAFDCINQRIAQGAAIALGLHQTAPAGLAANDMGWKSAEERINKPQLKLLWELQHTAPPKSRRIYQAIANCADQPKHRSRQLAPWAERVLALAEELEMPDIYTTSKREWTAQAKAALAAKHGTHWHDALQKRTKPPAPLAAAHHPMTRRTWRQPPRQPRTTGPLDFIGARITKAFSGIDHDGRIIAYDPKTRYWKCKYEDDDEEELSHAELVKHGPSDLICHPLPGTTEHTLGRYLPTRTPGSLAWYITDPSLTPYQRRLWPRLITDSDLAACRSKYAPNHYQLCSCDNAPLEDAFHVLFDCARHSDSARAALLRASARWCARANIPHDVEGRRTALHWAMTDQPPPSSPRIALRSPTACAELRQCIQHCYALSLSRRYNKTKDAASQHLANK